MWSILNAAILLSADPAAENFDDPALPPGWSHERQELKRMTAPSGEKLLGPLGPGRLSLHRDGLPRHQAVRVSFDLFFVGWWDGALLGLDELGPDVWSCGPRGGPALISATFNNTGKSSKDMCWQSFPENHRDAMVAGLRRRQDGYKFRLLDASVRDFLHYYGRGALDHGHLGRPASARHDNDSRYRLSLVFRHQGESLDFDFGGDYRHGLGRQWYGIDRVQVETLAEIPPLSPAAEASLWLDLLGDSSEKALEAKFQLALHPDGVLEKLLRRQPRATALPLPDLLVALRLPPASWREERPKWLGRGGRRQLGDLRLLVADEDKALAHLEELIQAAAPLPEWNSRQLWRLADLHRLCQEPGGAEYTRELESLAVLAMPLESEAQP
ncbi:MAG: hypothetical protein RL095_3364 [Verrucomicrobiota bacterium]|jgi:hypothetical protein